MVSVKSIVARAQKRIDKFNSAVITDYKKKEASLLKQYAQLHGDFEALTSAYQVTRDQERQDLDVKVSSEHIKTAIDGLNRCVNSSLVQRVFSTKTNSSSEVTGIAQKTFLITKLNQWVQSAPRRLRPGYALAREQIIAAINTPSIPILNLNGLGLQTLPDIFDYPLELFQNLTSLGLSGNQLTTLPPSITNLANLQILDLSNNRFSVIPDEITQLVNLSSLNVSHNFLGNTLPYHFERLVNLEKLNLSFNKISYTSPKIGELGNLKELNLEGNTIRVLFAEVYQSEKLETLNLSRNSIEWVPEDFKDVSLNFLDLTGHRLRTLPSFPNVKLIFSFSIPETAPETTTTQSERREGQGVPSSSRSRSRSSSRSSTNSSSTPQGVSSTTSSSSSHEQASKTKPDRVYIDLGDGCGFFTGLDSESDSDDDDFDVGATRVSLSRNRSSSSESEDTLIETPRVRSPVRRKRSFKDWWNGIFNRNPRAQLSRPSLRNRKVSRRVGDHTQYLVDTEIFE